jgi:hypothetical protein
MKIRETQLKYVITFVADMDKAMNLYRDVLGLAPKFESPGWSRAAYALSLNAGSRSK